NREVDDLDIAYQPALYPPQGALACRKEHRLTGRYLAELLGDAGRTEGRPHKVGVSAVSAQLVGRTTSHNACPRFFRNKRIQFEKVIDRIPAGEKYPIHPFQYG